MDKQLRQYYKVTKAASPSPLLINALKILGRKGKALDLGCGAGRDTRLLLQYGFLVTAVDKEPSLKEILKSFRPQHKLHIVTSRYERFNFATYDLINAQFALPFVSKNNFNKVFEKIKNSIKPKGIFTGQLFGLNDDWNTSSSNLIFHTKRQVKRLFRDMDLVELSEIEKEGQTANGTPKHWHIFNIIARKPKVKSSNN